MNARISVALCTCDGARYLEEQLASIARQTRPPDELIVCDDRSSDGTVEILRRFATQAPFPVRCEINGQRLGVAGNFGRAIGLCSGDLIALGDQDDVWQPEKLERLMTALERDPGAGLAFTDADVVDEALRPLGYSLWEAVGFSARDRRQMGRGHAVAVLLRRQVVTGATLVFRAAFRNLILPIPRSWMHDGWIAFLIAGVARLAAIPERLIRYRQHESNQIGARGLPILRLAARATRTRTRHRLELAGQALVEARDRLGAGGLALGPHVLDLIDDAAAHLQTRTALPASRWGRTPLVAREVLNGRYRRYSDGIVSVIEDLVL